MISDRTALYFFFYYPLGVALDGDERPWLSWALMTFMVGLFTYFQINTSAAILSWEWWVYFPGDSIKPGLVLSIFNHGGWVHLIGNLIYFWTFAPSLERALGRLRFLLLFLFLGFMANLCQSLSAVYFFPEQLGYGVVGASGAISGLMALFVIRFPYARIRTAWVIFAPLYGQVKTGIKHVPSVLAIATWVAFQLISALVHGMGGTSSTAFGTHFGGLLVGLLLGVGLRLYRPGAQYLHRHRADQAFAKGNWLRAYEAVQPLLDSSDPEDLTLAARISRLVGQTRQARMLFLKATQSALLQKDEAGAAACFAEALRYYPDLALLEEDMHRLILAMDRLGEIHTPLRAFHTFRALYPRSRHISLLMLRAARMEEIHDHDEARKLYHDFMRLFPCSPYVQLARSSLRGLEGA